MWNKYFIVQHPQLAQKLRESIKYSVFFNPLLRSAFLIILNVAFNGFYTFHMWATYNEASIKDKALAFVRVGLSLLLVTTVYFVLKKKDTDKL